VEIKKYIRPVIGAAAFIIGGLMARESALETVDVLSKKFENHKHKGEVSAPVKLEAVEHDYTN
jgi:hypothetical protein